MSEGQDKAYAAVEDKPLHFGQSDHAPSMFRTANEYLERHEEDSDRADQDTTMKTLLLVGAAGGFMLGVVSICMMALVVKALK